MPDEERIPVKEIDDQEATAEYLQVPIRTIEDWRYRHMGPPFVKMGRSIRYRKKEVDRWLETRVVDPEHA